MNLLGYVMFKLEKIAVCIVVLFIILCFHGCVFTGFEFGGEFTVTTTDDEKSIYISVNQVNDKYVSLYVTANINSTDVPVYRNGQLYGHINLTYNQSVEFIDFDVIVGNTYYYQAGGFFFPGGEIWSNIVIVTIP